MGAGFLPYGKRKNGLWKETFPESVDRGEILKQPALIFDCIINKNGGLFDEKQ
jgi:hypothetical protein